MEFLAIDRCDRCGAQAYHRAIKSKLELLFCNHHYEEHRLALIRGLWHIEHSTVDLTQEEVVYTD